MWWHFGQNQTTGNGQPSEWVSFIHEPSFESCRIFHGTFRKRNPIARCDCHSCDVSCLYVVSIGSRVIISNRISNRLSENFVWLQFCSVLHNLNVFTRRLKPMPILILMRISHSYLTKKLIPSYSKDLFGECSFGIISWNSLESFEMRWKTINLAENRYHIECHQNRIELWLNGGCDRHFIESTSYSPW